MEEDQAEPLKASWENSEEASVAGGTAAEAAVHADQLVIPALALLESGFGLVARSDPLGSEEEPIVAQYASEGLGHMPSAALEGPQPEAVAFPGLG